MKLIPLPYESKVFHGFNFILRLTSDDLKAWTSGTAQAVLPDGNSIGGSSITLPAGTTIGRVMARVVTAFTSADGAITTLTISLGDGSSATRFINALTLKATGYTASSNLMYPYAAADTVDATAAIVGQTMASLNAGQVDIYLEVMDTVQLAGVK